MMHHGFYLSHNMTHFLFEGWSSHDSEGIALICLLSGVLAFLAEFFNLMVDYLHVQASQLVILQPSPGGSTDIQQAPALVSPLLIPPSIEAFRKTKIKYHVCHTMVHVTRLVVGYFIMLAVMTYNGWIAISVIIGCGLGYFLFGFYRESWRISDETFQDVGPHNDNNQRISFNDDERDMITGLQ